MGSVFTLEVGALTTMQCSVCAIGYAIPEQFHAERQKDRGTFYCPNGHMQWYPNSNPDKQRIAQLEAQVSEEQRRRMLAEEAQKWAESTARGARISRGKAEAKVKRTLARVHAGVCPHCNRTFKQLAAHMKTQHAAVAKR